jgi:hypothetical protein
MSFDNPAGWVVSAQGTNSTATATRSAPSVAGFGNVVMGVTTSFSAATTTAASLTISDGASQIYSVLFSTGTTAPFSRTFAHGLKVTSGNACSASLSAGGSTIVGSVNLDGISI